MRIYPLFLPYAGCPHRCVFCRQEGGSGGSTPSPDEALIRLDAMLPGGGAGEIAFFGGSFTLLPASLQGRYLQAARTLVGQGRAAGIRISTRPDALSDETLRFLRAQGVTTIEIGCQSFCETVLRLSQRGHSPADAADAVARTRRYGFAVGVQLMPGLPGADGDEGRRSLCRALELRPDFVRIYPAVVLRGTAMASMWASGDYRPMSVEEAVELCADLLLLCRDASVPVIRLGLQGTAELESSVVAGPWHPAFGQLVRSRLWRRALARIAETARAMDPIRVHPADLAEALGHRRENAAWLHAQFGAVRLVSDPRLSRNEIGCAKGVFSLDALAAGP